MHSWRIVGALLLAAVAAVNAWAQGTISDLPRKETLIVENPEGTIKNAGWFNIWSINAGGQSTTGLHQLAMDTFWYIDPESGVDGVWDNSLASEKPIYNSDFTEMTVKLRKGIFWSDGVEFSADDVLYTIQTHMKTNGLRWSAPIQVNVADVSSPDPQTVVFKLKKPNSRFHTLFTVRWNAMWMMPKHIFEKAGDPLKFAFNPPISLGAYTLNSFDPNGKWFIWQRRDDWQRTTLARFGQPGPKYVAYVDAGPPDKRVIAQMNHELDIIHDTSPEGMFTLAKQSKSSHGWFKGFPYAHPDPTLPAVVFNDENDTFKNKDVRWALALLIDIKAVSMASYRGAATISAIGVPPTGSGPEYYHAPLESWLRSFEIDTGKQKFKPYDPTVGKQIADMLRPSLKDQIPTDPARDRQGVRPRLVEAQSAGGSRNCWKRAGFKKRDEQGVVSARRQAVLDQADGRGRRPAGDDPRRQHDRPAVAPFRHRRHDRRRAGQHVRPPLRRRFRRHDHLERRDLGRPSRPVVLPRQLAFAVRRRARQAAAAAQLAALVQPRTRQDHRAGSPDRLRRSQGYRARPRLCEARDARDADHSADVVQRVHSDGRHLLDRLSERGDRALHRSGAELGQHQVHDGEAEAPAVRAYPAYLLTRLGQFALVVFIGINITFAVTHATPIDPVEQSIAAATAYGSTSPEAIELMRQSLKELYGLQGGLGDQYLSFWRRVLVADFGPSALGLPGHRCRS